MIYSEVISLLLEAFPGINDTMNDRSSPDLPHVFMSLSVLPYFKDIVTNGVDFNQNLSERFIQFLEDMAKSDDVEVANLLCDSFLEPLLFDSELLEKSKPLFLERTRENLDRLKVFYLDGMWP